jgi:dihydroorotate dehydrogenase
MTSGLYSLAKPFLFATDPEWAHDSTLKSLDYLPTRMAIKVMAGPKVKDPVTLMGIEFPNRVGLAAGLDKDGAHIAGLNAMGFGFIEVGTVTPKPQPGNPKPRMFRIPECNALINRLGFNNLGVDNFIANVKRTRFKGVLGLNIGKNASTPIENALDDYLYGLDKVHPYASYITVNISSPNTKNLRQLQGADELSKLLSGLKQARAKLAKRDGRKVPIALKIAPDLDGAQIAVIAELLPEYGMDAVIATNTTLSRSAIEGQVHAEEAGGLSGAPVLEASNQVIRQLRRLLPRDFPIIGVGGIMSARDALSKMESGADLVQLYTGLIYAGPALPGLCARALKTMGARATRG